MAMDENDPIFFNSLTCFNSSFYLCMKNLCINFIVYINPNQLVSGNRRRSCYILAANIRSLVLLIENSFLLIWQPVHIIHGIDSLMN